MADIPLAEGGEEERGQQAIKAFSGLTLHDACEAEPLQGVERSTSSELKGTVEEVKVLLDIGKLRDSNEIAKSLPYSPQLRERLATQTPPSPGRDVFHKPHEQRRIDLPKEEEEEELQAAKSRREEAVRGQQIVMLNHEEEQQVQEKEGEGLYQVGQEEIQRLDSETVWNDHVEHVGWAEKRRNGRRNKGKKMMSESSESDLSDEESFQSYVARNRERRAMREKRRRSRTKEEEKQKWEREKRDRERGKGKGIPDEGSYSHVVAQEKGHTDSGFKAEKRESEELQTEIERNMKNDQLKVKEQTTKLKKVQEIVRRKKESLHLSEKEKKTLDELLPYTCFGHPESISRTEQKPHDDLDATSAVSVDEEFDHVVSTDLGIFTSIPQKKQVERKLKERDIRLEIEKLIRYLKLMKVQSVASNQSRRVIAVSGALNIIQTLEFFEKNAISSAPVYDEEGRTIGLIDGSDMMAFVLISERPSMLQEVLKTYYENDPFSKPVADMIGASGKNQFTMIRHSESVYELMKIFSLGRPSACVLDGENMISWVVSQSSVIALLHEYVINTAPSLGRILITELSMIVTKVPCVSENVKARDAFVSLCIHQISAAAVINEKGHLIAEISPNCLKNIDKDNMSDFYLPLKDFVAKARAISRFPEAVMCRCTVTFKQLLDIFTTKKAHRVWVVDKSPTGKYKVIGLVSLASIIRSILGLGCLHDQRPVSKKVISVLHDITNPDHWPQLKPQQTV